MIITLVAFFVVLGVLVLVHELGHFVTAKRGGVRVEEFGFGLPPRIFGIQLLSSQKLKKIAQVEVIDLSIKEQSAVENKQIIEEKIVDKVTEIDQIVPVRKWRLVWFNQKIDEDNNQAAGKWGTVYSLNWIPLGGFVKIKGEEGGTSPDPDSFVNKSVWRRIWIISAGVLMNLVLAAFLLSISLTLGSPQFIDGNLPKMAQVRDVEIRVMEVLPDSPANQAGMEVGDVVLAVDNNDVLQIGKLQDYFTQKISQKVSLTIKRDGKILVKEMTPQLLSQTNKGGVGVALTRTGFVSYPWYIAWWYGLIKTFEMVGGVFYGFYLIIKSLVVSHQMIGDVYGPVGIATLVGDAARSGFLYILQFTAVLSIIIAVINFLPFPALDGGRVFFLLIEAIRKKPINQKLEAALHNIGFALLMILVVIVTFRDIARVSSGFLNWWQKLISLF